MAVLAQRLVRRVCQECREQYRPSDEEIAKLGMSRDRFRRDGGGELAYREASAARPATSRLPRPHRHLRAAHSSTMT
jgi:type II secretory ATPase GspE/PulE/Tfp pilus assembly ATPase PilB-like protein